MGELFKKILLSLILVITLTNFITPNYSNAFLDAGDLVKPIFNFIAWVGDRVMDFLQGNLGDGLPVEPNENVYYFSFSPGNIFANNIATFDANFIEPNEYEPEEKKLFLCDVQNLGIPAEWLDAAMKEIMSVFEEKYGNGNIVNEGGKLYLKVIPGMTTQKIASVEEVNKMPAWYAAAIGGLENIKIIDGWYCFSIGNDQISIASELQTTISKWYKGLRRLTLVGLLSVLVYIGIRVIISSSSEDKAKYKKMLSNWVAAICIVFVLHYIMVFIMNISESLIDIIKTESVDESLKEDIAMKKIRTNIGDSPQAAAAAVYTIEYVVLVIYTVMFTIQYLKRVVYLAFLTMIAPLIALTYPLDKIKDGKAQAFTMWLREYTFNAMIQPVHLLLYVIFVSGIGVDFLTRNPLYSIVAIGFLLPAEKFFKKMFGMDSQSSVGTLGAAAGGAMVMNMLNKLKGSPPKQGGEQPANIRTSDQNGGVQQLPPTVGGVQRTQQSPTIGGNTGARQNSSTLGENQGPAPEVARFEEATGMQARDVVAPLVGTGAGLAGAMLTSDPSGSRPNTTEGVTLETVRRERNASINGEVTNSGSNSSRRHITPVSNQRFTRKQEKPSVWRGLDAVASKYIYGKEGRARARRTILGAAGGIAGATIGIAAGVATGDLGNAFSYGIGGATAGAIGARNLGENIISGARKIKNAETFKKGYMGEDSYNNAQIDKQLLKGENNKIPQEQYGKDINGDMQNITETEKMEKLLENGVTGETYEAYANAGVRDIDKIIELQTAGVNGTPITAEEYGAYADAGVRDVNKIRELQTAGVNGTPITPKEYGIYADAGVRDTDKIKELTKAGVDATKYAELASAGITNINTIKKHKGKTAAQLINMKKIATHSKKVLENADMNDIDKKTGVPRVFVNYAREFGVKDNMIKELYENLEDFM